MGTIRVLSCITFLLVLASTVSGQNVSVAPPGWPHTIYPDSFIPWGVGDPRGDLGDVPLGGSSAVIFDVQSGGPTPLTIYSFELMGNPDSVFGLSHPPIVPELEAFDSMPVTVDFTPIALQTYETTLRIISNDRETPVVDLPLFGTGVDANPIPEPAMLLLIGSGLASLGLPGARRKLRL